MTWSEHYPLLTAQCFSNDEVNTIWNMRPEKPHKIRLFNKIIDTPRLQQAYGKDYKFSGTIAVSKPIPKCLLIE